MKTVESIIHEYLIQNGYDGLCNDDCGCSMDDLIPCCGDCSGCVPAYRTPCPGGDRCPYGGCDWHFTVTPRDELVQVKEEDSE